MTVLLFFFLNFIFSVSAYSPLDENPDLALALYRLKGSKKKSVPKRYFYKRMYLYKKRYEQTFGKDWIKKFKSKYRIKKKKDKNYKTDLTYYRKYKGFEEVQAGDVEVKFKMR
ncbi:MAG: hypothetical protein GF347_02035 [Candidatus Moranbacteria bacterium]|nr:hypothetical protein [Candidatus Moranbacteria bacterium]